MQLIIQNRQSILDVAMKFTGDSLNAFEIAKYNDLAISDNLQVGQKLLVPEGLKIDQEIVNYYEANRITPVTGLTKTQQDLVIGCEGIGCWMIGSQFQIS